MHAFPAEASPAGPPLRRIAAEQVAKPEAEQAQPADVEQVAAGDAVAGPLRGAEDAQHGADPPHLEDNEGVRPTVPAAGAKRKGRPAAAGRRRPDSGAAACTPLVGCSAGRLGGQAQSNMGVLRALGKRRKPATSPELMAGFRRITPPGFEPGQREPKSLVLPLHYGVVFTASCSSTAPYVDPSLFSVGHDSAILGSVWQPFVRQATHTNQPDTPFRHATYAGQCQYSGGPLSSGQGYGESSLEGSTPVAECGTCGQAESARRRSDNQRPDSGVDRLPIAPVSSGPVSDRGLSRPNSG